MPSSLSAAMGRLPKYLAYLKVRQKQGIEGISSTQIAEDLHLNAVQVRKDLALASSAGRPRTGYPLGVLIADLECFLGYHNTQDAFLVGAGRLGRALLGYDQFAEYGLSILAAFDRDPLLHGKELSGKPVMPMHKLDDLVRRMQVHIGILTVSTDSAQAVCDALVHSGIRAIWNFTPVLLQVPEHIIVQNENLASSFAVLSKQLTAALTGQGNKEGGNHREHHERQV